MTIIITAIQVTVLVACILGVAFGLEKLETKFQNYMDKKDNDK